MHPSAVTMFSVALFLHMGVVENIEVDIYFFKVIKTLSCIFRGLTLLTSSSGGVILI